MLYWTWGVPIIGILGVPKIRSEMVLRKKIWIGHWLRSTWGVLAKIDQTMLRSIGSCNIIRKYYAKFQKRSKFGSSLNRFYREFPRQAPPLWYCIDAWTLAQFIYYLFGTELDKKNLQFFHYFISYQSFFRQFVCFIHLPLVMAGIYSRTCNEQDGRLNKF